MEKNWTVNSILEWTEKYLRENNIESPRLEAEILLSNAMLCKRLELNAEFNKTVPKEQLEVYKKYIKERKRRKPLSYILGNHEFMGMTFKVNENTLIPRPETELLVEEVIELIKNGHNKTVIDLGTGSGNIAVSLAKLSNVKKVYALDISVHALSVCCENINNNGQGAKVIPRQSDIFEGIKSELAGNKADIIISNPPYVTQEEFTGLEPEISFEPRVALDGGKDGMSFYKKIASESSQYLKSRGYLVLEMNSNLSTMIMGLVEDNGYRIEKIVKDYSGLNRVLIAGKTEK